MSALLSAKRLQISADVDAEGLDQVIVGQSMFMRDADQSNAVVMSVGIFDAALHEFCQSLQIYAHRAVRSRFDVHESHYSTETRHCISPVLGAMAGPSLP